MRDPLATFVEDDLPKMDPVIAYEETEYGWRGLTLGGEVLEVRSTNGHKASVPESIIVAHAGQAVGRREVTNNLHIYIGDYLKWFNMAVESYQRGLLDDALAAADLAYGSAPTLRARFNRAMILLACGDWDKGFEEYWQCEQSKPFMRPQVERALALGLRPWRGEPYRRLMLLHAHGLGDTIMCLRYAPQLDKEVVAVVPPELRRTAEELCQTAEDIEQVDADFFCPMLHLPRRLGVTPKSVTGAPYLKFPPSAYVRDYRIGVAWSVGKPSPGDYPRSIALHELVDMISGGGEIHSVQAQGADEAECCGVIHHSFKDFAECAELMSTMDEIISVDTAALHLAGAIGHPNVYGLLSHWASWRWQARWYDRVRLLRQESPGDWRSAMAQRRPL
jgi:hypothetical protein